MADILTSPPIAAPPGRGDCPECGAAGSLIDFFCEVCYAELDEAGDVADG